MYDQCKRPTYYFGVAYMRFKGNRLTLEQSNEGNAPFTFDRVFGMSSQQIDIFDFSIRSTVEDVMNGYNGTVFAYGQTGAGKSFTMMGDMDDREFKGVTPRIMEQIFDAIMTASSTIEFTVGIGYMEIYMERIRDLMAPSNDNLPINEGPRGPFVKGLREIFVSSVDEVYQALHIGQRSRATASTNMNLESSRSHSIFVVTIKQKDTSSGTEKVGTLYLVDLAGSEKVGKTGASGQTLEEAKKINKSLSALGMVINSLTDGKSSHIPYRDSKLTRILQESLGGNSRTTLIINCSPSSYNDAETLSTLRFGMRAKTIKNKAKINAELSPAELKRQLKSVQSKALTFEKYIASLDVELQQWRNGNVVPKEQWTPSLTNATTTSRSESRPPRPETPSRLHSDSLRADTPSRPDSRTGDRSSTPSMIVEKDEREEYLRRENELQDQIAEKETQVANAERGLQEAKDELRSLKDGSIRLSKENDSMTDRLNKAEMELQKLSFQSKEDIITMDSLKEANSELETELISVKQQLLDVKMSARETSAVLDEKDRKKQERMATMMAGFDLGSDAFSENERKIQSLVEQVDSLHETSSSGNVVAPDSFVELRARLVESQGFIRQAESHMNDRSELSELQDHKRVELEEKLATIEQEYEDLLERNLSSSDVDELKEKLGKAYAERRDTQASLVADLRNELTYKTNEIKRLQQSAVSSPSRPHVNGASPATNGVNSKTLQQQISDFDLMKKSLMRDLQNRCERVVELEISLDETREQYNNVLRSSNNRQQQKKMAFLERNLEQLTVVQRQLVEQNTSLKKEVAIAERKLIARNERIVSLENLLGDSQEKLTAANHRYVGLHMRIDIVGRTPADTLSSFETQLQAVKERLEAAKVSSRNLPNSPSAQSGFSFGGAGARIAKPLRGGGGADSGSAMSASIPILSSLQGGDSSGGGKRTSWFFNNRS
jgi:kinesin family protein 5